MSPEEFSRHHRAQAVAPIPNVSLSSWVNERFPAWEQILSAHDVARLTHRPRWVVSSLVFLRIFPRKHRFHGREIGWLRADVLDWLAKGPQRDHCQSSQTSISRRRVPSADSSPFGGAFPCAARVNRMHRMIACDRPRRPRTMCLLRSRPSR